MNNFMTKLATLLIVIFVFVFAGYQCFRYFGTGYKTEVAFQFEVARFCDTKGLLIRTEEALDTHPDGVVRYLAKEGQRFRGITPIAEVYANQAQVDDAAERDALRSELEVLQKVQKEARSSQLVNIQQLNGSINSTVLKLGELVAYGELDGLNDTRLELVELLGRKELVGGSEEPLEEHISELEAQVAGQDGGRTIYSSQAGYFSRYVDGYEEKITPDLLKKLDGIALQELVEQEYPYDRNAFGKSVTSHNWYYAASVSPEEAEKFTVGNQVKMTFLGGTGETLSAVVDRVDKEGDSVLVVLRSDQISADTVSRRVANVRIGFRDYSGLRIAKDALRIVDGKKGVYVKIDGKVTFKQVEIIYTSDDFYLTRLQQGSDTYLNLFEEVFVEGKDLYDGKTIEF